MLLAGAKIDRVRASPVNPAIAFMITLFNSNSRNWASIWILVGGGFVGSILSLVFFKFVYQKTQEAMEDMEEEEESNNDQPLMDE